MEGNLLVASAMAEIVGYTDLDQDVIVAKKVRVLGKSCFEACKHLDRIDFGIGS
jgi:hypothetical protein